MKYTIKYGAERKSVYNKIEPSFPGVIRIIMGNELKKVHLMTLPLGAADNEATVELVECEHCVKHAYAVVPTPFGFIYHSTDENDKTEIKDGYHDVIIDSINKEIVIF